MRIPQLIRKIASAFSRKITGVREMLFFDNGLALVVDRLLYPSARMAAYRFGTLEIAVDRAGGDLASIRTCLASPMYRTLLGQVRLRNTIRVLDVGANVGGFSLLLLSLGYRFDQLVAVELNPNTALRLEHNLAGNLRSSRACARVLVAGAAGASGLLKAKFGWGSTGDCIESTNTRESSDEREIPLRTLDDIISSEFGDEQIDVCKIDVEGAEHAIFAANSYHRLSQARYLIIEIHDRPGHIGHRVVSAIQQLDFELKKRQPTTPDDLYLFENRRFVTGG